jgi:putative polyhydroxyalkanoate system protein
MAKKTIERHYPGKSAQAIYLEVEKVIRAVGQKYGIQCQYDATARRIVVPETMGVKGLCVVIDERVQVDLEHGLMGTAVAGPVKSYIEEKLKLLFAS